MNRFIKLIRLKAVAHKCSQICVRNYVRHSQNSKKNHCAKYARICIFSDPCSDVFSAVNTRYFRFKPLNANPIKWLNTFEQLVGKLPMNCLSVFDNFVGLAIKGLIPDVSLGFLWNVPELLFFMISAGEFL